MPKPLIVEQTVQYKTYLKRALVEAMRNALEHHPDPLLQKTRTTIEFPQTEADYPTIVVRFFERDIRNAGIGHREYIKGVHIEGDGVVTLTGTTPQPLPEWYPGAEVLNMHVPDWDDDDWAVHITGGTIQRTPGSSIPSGTQIALEYMYTQPNSYTLMKHSLYSGTVQFVIYALSSLDRDLVSDTLVEIIRMGDISDWANDFIKHIYDRTEEDEPYSLYHYVNIDTDNLRAYGETQAIAPWMPEDVMVYQATYGVEVFGELYSAPPRTGYPLIEAVDVYPYIEGIEPRPDGANDPAPWISEDEGFG